LKGASRGVSHLDVVVEEQRVSITDKVTLVKVADDHRREGLALL
jgi:hypothetical protein